MRLVRFAAAFLLLILASAPGVARADDAPLFHVTEATVACADETSVRNLTNQNEVRRNNQAWYKATFDSGRCVSVTPKSPWRFVSRDNDVAMMDYAGTVGPPGSYYFNAAQLVDPNGNHPGDTPPAAAPAANGNPPAAAANTSSAETALAPSAQPTSPAPADTSVQPTWGVTNVLLLAVALLLAAVVGLLIGRRGPRV